MDKLMPILLLVGAIILVYLFTFAMASIDTQEKEEAEQARKKANKKIEDAAKPKIYTPFHEIIQKYYRVITKHNTCYTPTYEVTSAPKLKSFYDVALLVGGDRAQAAQAENLKNMEEAGGGFLEGQKYGFFFHLYPFTEIPLESILSLPLSTLTTFILDTVGEAFDLSESDVHPDRTIIQDLIEDNLRQQKQYSQQIKRQGQRPPHIIPLLFEQALNEYLLRTWSNKLELRRRSFDDYLKDLEEKFDTDVVHQNGYLIYGKPIATYPRERVSIARSVVDCQEDVYKHAYIIGRTGAGKTTLIKNLAAQHIQRGRGLIVLSPENDLIEELLDRIPPERSADLVYFDPTTTVSPIVSLNPFTLEEGELLFQRQGEVYNILTSAMGELGESMENLLNKCVYTLLQRPDSSLLDIKRLLKPADDFRRAIVQDERIDPDTREFWRDTYGAKGSYYPKSADAILRRLDAFLMPPLSTCISRASFSLSGALNGQKSLFLFNLSRLKGLQAEMMGQLIVAMVLQTLLARDQQRPADRLPYHLIIDEFQTYAGTSEQAFTEMLNRARKYRMSVTLAHQATENISASLLGTIIANAGTLVCMERPASDATYFAKELQLYQDDRSSANARALQNLLPHHFYLRTPINKLAALVATELDRFPKIPLPHGVASYEAWREYLKNKSRQNFGRAIDQPEATPSPAPAPATPKATPSKPPPAALDDEENFRVF